MSIACERERERESLSLGNQCCFVSVSPFLRVLNGLQGLVLKPHARCSFLRGQTCTSAQGPDLVCISEVPFFGGTFLCTASAPRV